MCPHEPSSFITHISHTRPEPYAYEDTIQFEKFGIPLLHLEVGPPNDRRDVVLYISNLQPNLAGGFATEKEARDYEAKILSLASNLMGDLKKKKDEFTSTTEVEL